MAEHVQWVVRPIVLGSGLFAIQLRIDLTGALQHNRVELERSVPESVLYKGKPALIRVKLEPDKKKNNKASIKWSQLLNNARNFHDGTTFISETSRYGDTRWVGHYRQFCSGEGQSGYTGRAR